MMLLSMTNFGCYFKVIRFWVQLECKHVSSLQCSSKSLPKLEAEALFYEHKQVALEVAQTVDYQKL